MYISINKWQFIGEFLKGPTSDFSYEGLCILYEYLNDTEDVSLRRASASAAAAILFASSRVRVILLFMENT